VGSQNPVGKLRAAVQLRASEQLLWSAGLHIWWGIITPMLLLLLLLLLSIHFIIVNIVCNCTYCHFNIILIFFIIIIIITITNHCYYYHITIRSMIIIEFMLKIILNIILSTSLWDLAPNQLGPSRHLDFLGPFPVQTSLPR